GGRRVVIGAGQVCPDDGAGHVHAVGIGGDVQVRAEVVHAVALCHCRPRADLHSGVAHERGVPVDFAGAHHRTFGVARDGQLPRDRGVDDVGVRGALGADELAHPRGFQVHLTVHALDAPGYLTAGGIQET